MTDTDSFQIRTMLKLSILCALLAAQLPAQQPAHYAIQRDTLRYELDNPFRMYWARGADTIGDRVRGRTVETHVWSGTADRPAVRVAIQSLNVSRFAKSSDYALTPAGHVVTEDGKAPTPGARADLLLPLPSQPLRVGVRWSDTTSTGPGTGAVGQELDEATTDWEVTRVLDTLGTRVAEVRAHGTWHMRLSYWVDSAAGRVAWLDVKGPMTERGLVDVTHWSMIERAWKMDLRGRGVPPSGAADTIAAGLISEETMRVSESPRTRFLLRPLPGADTSVTVEPEHNSPILLHTTARDRQAVTASLARNDGMVGVAHAAFDGAVVRSYDATWADTGHSLVTRQVVRRGNVLRVTRSGSRDTVVAVPGRAWGIADYSMQELLVPVLLALPRDTAARDFAVYRPFAAHWDTGIVVVHERAGMLIFTLTVGSGGAEVLVVTPDGDYLYGENSGPDSAKRFPGGAKRQEQLRTLFATLRGGG